MRLPRRLPSLLLLALLGVGNSVLAKPPTGPPPRQAHERPPRNDDALSDSVRRIERSTRGQVLSAERVPFDGRSVNRIKVVDDRGRVRVYMDDPKPQQPQPLQSTPSQSTPPTRGDDD